MKVWITKYALTTGIEYVDVECFEEVPGMVRRLDSWSTFYHGKDWHKGEGSAIARAEEMRKRMIASLRKEIAELEALKWT